MTLQIFNIASQFLQSQDQVDFNTETTMALYKQKGSKYLWYEFQLDGVPYRRSTKTTSKTLAAEVLRAARREAELTFNGIKKREKPKTLAVAADEYLKAKEGNVAPRTLELLQREVAHLLPVFGKMRLIDITPADIKKFKDARRFQKTNRGVAVSPRGVNMDLEALRAILRRNGLWERIRPDFSLFKLRQLVGSNHRAPKHPGFNWRDLVGAGILVYSP
jgi:hypothetical protein